MPRWPRLSRGRAPRWSAALAVLAVAILPAIAISGVVASALAPPSALFPAPRTDWSELATLLARTLALALAVAAVALPLGTWLAWIDARLRYRGADTLGALCLLPMAIPSYVLAATLRDQLEPSGLLGGPFTRLGLEIGSTGFGPSCAVLALATTPYVQLIVGAALARVSASEEEVARSLGASTAERLRLVVLPRLRPAMAYAGLLTLLYVIADFGAVAVLDCRVLTWRLYSAAIHAQTERAALLGLALLAAALPVLVATRAVAGRAAPMTSVANPRSVPAKRPGRTVRAAALATQLTVVALGVGLPIATLISWIVNGLRFQRDFASLIEPLSHSVLVASLGAAATLGLAGLPAWIGSRSAGGVGRGALAAAVSTTAALPGILVGFGLMGAALTLDRSLEAKGALYAGLGATGTLLVAGYVVRFLAEAEGPLLAGMSMLDQRQLDSARVLGAGRWRRLRWVLWPALEPSAAAAYLLVFVSILKELPITLLLGGPTGLRPLSQRLWDRHAEGFLHDAGLAGLTLVALALGAAVVARRRPRHHGATAST